MPDRPGPHWAPRVPRSTIRRLYELDAQGILDPGLIDEVGWALWERCDSILLVTAAHHGRLPCPACGAAIERQAPWTAEEMIECPQCGWQLPWAEYHRSYRGKQLFGANAVDIFQACHAGFQRAGSPREKMLLIDRLIHAFHIRLSAVGRPAAANLIQGSLQEVIHFLDGLSGGDASAAGLEDSRTPWRRTLASADWSREFLDPGQKTTPGG